MIVHVNPNKKLANRSCLLSLVWKGGQGHRLWGQKGLG